MSNDTRGPSQKVASIRDAWKAEQARQAAEPTGAAAENEKVRENRLRRMAERQGLRVTKSRRRDPRAREYGTYGLADLSGNLVAGDISTGYGLTLDQVESALLEK